jgi:hypothetical protein
VCHSSDLLDEIHTKSILSTLTCYSETTTTTTTGMGRRGDSRSSRCLQHGNGCPRVLCRSKPLYSYSLRHGMSSPRRCGLVLSEKFEKHYIPHHLPLLKIKFMPTYSGFRLEGKIPSSEKSHQVREKSHSSGQGRLFWKCSMVPEVELTMTTV